MSDGFSDGGLLAGLEAPPREGGVRQEKSTEAQCAHEAWRAWARETGRPDADTTSRQFLTAYIKQIRAGRKHEYLLEVVRGAARLPIHANNVDDTRRVINALKTSSTSKTAVSALRTERPVIAYPGADEEPLKSEVTDIADACRVPPSEWTERDQEAAGILMQNLTSEEVDDAAVRACQTLGVDAVLPIELLRAHRSARSSSAVTAGGTKARSTYAAGMAERERVGGVDFSIDDLANEMLISGAKASEIVRVHQMAPEGYWDAVFALAVEGDSNEDAYRRLEQQFDEWHPECRREGR